MREIGRISTAGLKSVVIIVFFDRDFFQEAESSAIRVHGGFGGKIAEGVVRYWPPNELAFTFGGSYVCANFGEHRSRNATECSQTDTLTDRHKPIL